MGPAGRPEPITPPSRARFTTAGPPRTHRLPEPARQAAGAETRHPAAPAGSRLELSTARRSAAPPAPARAERTEGCPLLAAGGIDARRSDARARRQPRAKLEPGAAQTLSAMDSKDPAAVSQRPCLEILSALAAGDCGVCLKCAELH